MDNEAYNKDQEDRAKAYEALCRCCGFCCGASTPDPCSNLVKQEDGRYLCGVYSNRLGPQKSMSGNIFTCVTMRDVKKHGISYPGCGYNDQEGDRPL